MCPAPQQPTLLITIASDGGHQIPRGHRKANIDRKLRDLQDDKIHLRKAVDTLVMGYLPTTSGTKRRDADDYARRLLRQLMHGISTTFQQDQELLETLSAQINALANRRNALTDQIENNQPSQGVEQAIQQSPTDWLLVVQTQLQKIQQRIHSYLKWGDGSA